ncbi:MAG: hypothetical protein Q4F01_01600 [Staphylococcus rostri]|uniref:hypothetical protein n=1 Tax=Staphylococcus rostri TaxID=522262 RepID=UPI0026DF0B0F|nr:hypothetical protein [Staphylococcus rostri]MDO5374879.1 hypothetical protein [Staphylococcus rostri]
MYKSYWLSLFNFKGVSKVSDLIICLMINIVILALINLVGIIVPVSMENAIVGIYYIVLFAMILPTVAMLFRVWNGYKIR